MPVVPISQQLKRQPQRQQPMADPKFLLMAAALMHGESKIKSPLDSPQSAIQPPQLQNPSG